MRRSVLEVSGLERFERAKRHRMEAVVGGRGRCPGAVRRGGHSHVGSRTNRVSASILVSHIKGVWMQYLFSGSGWRKLIGMEGRVIGKVIWDDSVNWRRFVGFSASHAHN